MAYDEKIAQRVRTALSGQRGLVEKKMMGGICFMLDGNMCCGVSGAALLVRVGREAYQQMLAQPHVRPMEFAGRRPRQALCSLILKATETTQRWRHGSSGVSTSQRRSRRKSPA